MLPVYITVALDVFLILLAIGVFMFSKRKGSAKFVKKTKPKETIPGSEEFGAQLMVAAEPIEVHEIAESPEIQGLMRSFRECIGADNVGLAFEFQDLSFEPKPGKSILSGISGVMQSGSFWAVMGGSGAGKSTFLNVLMGKTKHTGGTVLVNGHQEKMKKYKKLIGYVPQDDIVLPELTVRENILHSARIRLPSNWKDEQIQEHVDTLIACLGLSHVSDSLVGDTRKPVISGGQRKRVSIGLELAAAPMALFLDEPTSGLDATSAASVMGLLRSISRLGVTTIAIIHQPRQEVFESIDNLLLLGNGQQIYAGETKEVTTYFHKLNFSFPQNRNPADVLMDIATGSGQQYSEDLSWREDSVQRLLDSWQRHSSETSVEDEKDEVVKDDSKPRTEVRVIASTLAQQDSLKHSIKKRGSPFFSQVWFCFNRAMLQQVRNPGSFFFEVGVGALAGAVIGLSAFSANGQLFKGIYHFPFTALSSAVDYQSAIQIGLLGGLAIG
jgi:ABC-type multidrug transport system ATPase subunit